MGATKAAERLGIEHAREFGNDSRRNYSNALAEVIQEAIDEKVRREVRGNVKRAKCA